MQIFLVLSLLIAILAVVFAVQNADTTSIQFLAWETEVPLAVVLLVSVLIGVLISILASSPSFVRSRLTIRNQKKRMSELETNLNDSKIKLAEAQQKALDLEKQVMELKTGVPVTPVEETPKTDQALT